MINFRYHVVSLIAVFLAFGMGILMGTTFIPEATVDQLRLRQEELRRTTEELQGNLTEANRRGTALSQFTDLVKPEILRGRLAGRAVVMIGFESTADEVLDGISTTLQGAGAQINAVLRLSEQVEPTTPERRSALANLLNTSSEDEEALLVLFTQRMSEALSGQKPGFIQAVIDAGLMQYRPIQDGPTFLPAAELSPPGSAIIIVGPEGDAESRITASIMTPLARTLAGPPFDTVSVACERGSSDFTSVAALRQEGAPRLVTVDGVESSLGQITVVLGTSAAFLGRFGHYGTGEGAGALIAPFAPPG